MDNSQVFDLIKNERRKTRETARERERALRYVGQTAEGKIILEFLREVADGPIYTSESDAAAMAFADGKRVLALTLIKHMTGGNDE